MKMFAVAVLSFAAMSLLSGECVVFRPGDVEVVGPAFSGVEYRSKFPFFDSFAAKELCDFLGEAFGEKVPRVDKPSGRRKFIQVQFDPALEHDDIRIEAGKGGVRIVSGAARVYGAYEFLERFAGCRFYFPGPLGTIVPKRRELAVPLGTVTVKPCYTQRSNNMNFGLNGDWYSLKGAKVADRIEATNLCFQARAFLRLAPRIPCCHGLNKFRYLARFGKTHPHYFSLMKGIDGTVYRDDANSKWTGHKGQLCHTSGIWEKEIYADAVRELSTNSYVDVMAQDGMQQCLCESCLKAYAPSAKDKNYATDLIWGKTVALADRLSAEGVKGYVTQMAYTPYKRIPDIKIPDNVLVMIAETGPWEMNAERLAEANAEIRAWSKKLGRKVWIWTYPGKFNRCKHPNVPQMTPRAYGKYYASLDDAIFGAFAEGKTDKWIYNYLNYYVKSKVEWNTKVDVAQLLDEHYRLMFGAAAKEMQAFYEMLEDVWLGKVAGNVVQTDVGPVTRSPTEWEKWQVIYSPAVLDEMKGLFDRAFAKVEKNPMELARLDFIKRQFYDPLRGESEKFFDKIDALRNSIRREGRENRSILKGTRFDAPDAFVLDGEWPQAKSYEQKLTGLLKPDTRYLVSYFVKMTNVVATSHNGGIGINLYDGERSIMHPKPAERTGTKDWFYQEYEIKTSSTIGKNAPPYLRIQVRGAKGKAWYKGVRVEEVTPQGR